MVNDLCRARNALHSIPPDLPRPEWVRAGMAAQAAGLGFDDFDTWSASAPSYDAQACRATWRSFKANKGVGAGTLFAMESEHCGRMGTDKPQRHAPAKPMSRPAETPHQTAPRSAPPTCGTAAKLRQTRIPTSGKSGPLACPWMRCASCRLVMA